MKEIVIKLTRDNFNFRFNNKPQINIYRLTTKNK